MAAKLPVWGIDIGQCSLKAIKLQAAGEGVELLAVDLVEHDTILSQAEGEAPALMKKSLEAFLSRNDLKNCQVAVSVPGQQTLAKFTKMPPVEKKKIPDMVQYEAGQQIPFDMDEVVWDYQVFTEEDSPDVEVGIFAIRRELIRNHLSYFTDLKIEPVLAQASPMATYNAVRFDNPPTEGQAMILLDMGAQTTDLIVMEGNTIWSRPVPIGGNRFTEALVSAFKVSFKKAEDLKRNAASTKYARQIFQAMRPVFADLVSEVQRSIGYYTSTHREAHISRVMGMGNAFKLPGLQKFLQQNLQVEVEKLSGYRKLSTSAVKSDVLDDNLMSFSVAYGLAVQGLGLGKVQSSLLPPEIAKSILWKRKRAWFIGAAACLALAGGLVWGKNSMVNAAISRGMGTFEKVDPARPATSQAAESKLASLDSGLPAMEYAKTVKVSAEYLKSELAKVQSTDGAAVAKLQAMSQLPQTDVYAPRIVDMIHRAFKEVSPPALERLDSTEQYLKLANDTPRPQRDEVWIDDLFMIYVQQNPDQVLTTDSTNRNMTPGWAVRLIGHTTRSQPETWIGQTLNKSLETLGREPGRGIYLDSLRLVKVTDSMPGISRTSRSSSSGGRGFQDYRTGGRDSSGRGAFGGIHSGGYTPPTQASGTRDKDYRKMWQAVLDDLEPKPGVDPVTHEPSTSDRWFELNFIVYKADTPKELIPDRFKSTETPEPASGAPKPAPAAPDRRG